MRPILKLAILVALAATCARQVHAQTPQTTVGFDSGSFILYNSSAKTTALTAGNDAVAGDGAVLQLGYYTGATTTNYFAGTFVPLSGQTSLNTAFNTTSIGDNPGDAAGAGTFGISLVFQSGSSTTGNSLPANGALLAIRFFNNTTLGSSTLYNAVSDSLWTWKTPVAAPSTANVAITLDQAGLQWLGGASTAFYTSQAYSAVPEPSTYAVSILGCIGLVALARRRRSAV